MPVKFPNVTSSICIFCLNYSRKKKYLIDIDIELINQPSKLFFKTFLLTNRLIVFFCFMNTGRSFLHQRHTS